MGEKFLGTIRELPTMVVAKWNFRSYSSGWRCPYFCRPSSDPGYFFRGALTWGHSESGQDIATCPTRPRPASSSGPRYFRTMAFSTWCQNFGLLPVEGISIRIFWSLWWGGIPVNRIMPLRWLRGTDLCDKNDRDFVSKGRYVMNWLTKAATAQDMLTEIRLLTVPQRRDYLFVQSFI